MLSLVSRAHRGPSAEAFRPEFLLQHCYSNTSARWFQSPRWQLGPVYSLLTALQSKMEAGGRVQRSNSQHFNPRWRLGAVYRVCSGHCNPRWRLGAVYRVCSRPCNPRWRLGPMYRVCSGHCNPRWQLGSVYREAAQSTDIWSPEQYHYTGPRRTLPASLPSLPH